jgi:hypothetical protein
MRQLHAQLDRRVRADRRDHLGQRGLVRIRVQAQVARRDAAVLQHGGRLDDQQRGARQREVAEMDHVPVAGVAVLGRVLAHRRDDDAILELDRADLQRLEQGGHGHSGGGSGRHCNASGEAVQGRGQWGDGSRLSRAGAARRRAGPLRRLFLVSRQSFFYAGVISGRNR